MEEWNWETVSYGHYRSIFNHCDVIGQQSNRIRWKKTQNKGYYAVQAHRGRYQSKASCEFLLVINSTQLIVQILDTVFLSPLWGLRDSVRCSFGLIEKRVVDFLLVLIELFSLGVTAEALRAKIDRKSTISLQRGQFERKFHAEEDVLHQSFLHGV